MEKSIDPVFTRLKEEGTSFGISGDYLGSSIQKLLLHTFELFEKLPYERKEQFVIPEEYLDFFVITENNTVGAPGQDLYIYGLFEMLSLTANYFDCHVGPGDQVVFWLAVGHRNDRGNFFLCCDKASELYGQVGEFYDACPFMDEDDFYGIGTGFADFCQNVLAGKVY